MNNIIDILDGDSDNYIEITKNDKRKNKKNIDSVVVAPLFPDADDYIPAPHPNLLELPFSLLLIAKKGSGKTTTIHNLLVWYKELFDNIYIWSPTVKIDKKWELIIKKLKIPDENIFDKLIESRVVRLIGQIKEVNAKLTQKKKIRSLLIFDDCVQELPKSKKVSFLNTLSFNHRHYSISYMVVSQSFKSLDSCVRSNASGIVLYNSDNSAERLKIVEELAGNLSKKQFYKIWFEAVKVKFGFLFINYGDRKIYKNFEKEIGNLDMVPESLDI